MACTAIAPLEPAGPGFPRFGALPKELQLHVWEQATAGREPRIVLLDRRELSTRQHEEGETKKEKRWGFRSPCPPPPLIVACRDSFAVARKYYRRAFRTEDAFAQTWFDFDRDFLYLKALRWTNLSESDLRCAYAAGLETIDAEERRQVQNLMTSDHEGIFRETNERPIFQLDGLCETVKGFENARRVVAVYLDGWTYEELENGACLVARKPCRSMVLRHLFRERYRPQNHCACFNRVVEHWEELALDGMNYWNIEQTSARIADLTSGTRPVIEAQMVCTPHVWAALDKSDKAHCTT